MAQAIAPKPDEMRVAHSSDLGGREHVRKSMAAHTSMSTSAYAIVSSIILYLRSLHAEDTHGQWQEDTVRRATRRDARRG